jgi:hypothetical protein
MEDMRTALLAELIDQMHQRLADKMFPPDVTRQDEPAATGIPGSEAKSDETMVEGEAHKEGEPATHGDIKGDETGVPGQEMTDEELDEMMKGLTND